MVAPQRWCRQHARVLLLLLLTSASSADPPTKRVLRTVRRAVPPPLVLADSSIVTAGQPGWEAAPGEIEAGNKDRAASKTASPVAQQKWTLEHSRRLLVASLLCWFLGCFGAHELYLGRNVAALRSVLTLNMLGLGVPLDALQLRHRVRELMAAEAEAAAEAAAEGALRRQRESVAPAPASESAAAPARVGLFGAFWLLLRTLVRTLPQFVFGRWVGFMCARTLPDAGGAAAVWLHAAGGAAAVWLSVALAGRRQPGTAAQIVAAAAAGPLGFERWLLSREPWLGEGVPSLLAAMGAANLPPLLDRLGWRRCAPATRCPPRRSARATLLVLCVGAAFWAMVACGALLRVSVPVTVDGRHAEINGRTLAYAATCALRPDRFVALLRTQLEPQCLKRQLEAALGPLQRFCVWPLKLNKCFDWDVDGTRWSRVGFTLVQAYHELGLRSGASSSQVRRAYRARVLHDHPDKNGGQQTNFMRAQRAYETIMEARRPASEGPSIMDLSSRGRGKRQRGR